MQKRRRTGPPAKRADGSRRAPALERELSRGLARLRIASSTELVPGLLRYLELLQKWNRVYNLSGVREPHAMLTRHLLDSLAILPFILGPRVLDVGTGAGLPGIPLALARPDLAFVLLDPSRKKARFLRQALAELRLANAEVVCERAEDFAPPASFDTVVARALAPIGGVLRMAGRLCAPHGRVLVMKGTYPQAELGGVPAGYAIAEVRQLDVPGLGAQRHLVVVAPRSRPTP